MGTAGRQVFSLVRRLHDELGVNTTCGASNVSFGLPNRNGLNGAFLAMAIANGMTSAITSPLHEEVRQAVMAADVLMGTDAHAESWIRRYGEGRSAARAGADGGVAGRGADPGRPRLLPRSTPRSPRRRRGDARAVTEAEGSLVVFTPSGKRGRFGDETNLLDAARSLGVDLDSVCGGRGICGRCQVVVSRGRVREARHHLARRPSHAVQRAGDPLPRAQRVSPTDRRLGLPRSRHRTTSSSTCRRRASCIGRSCARRPTRIRSRSTRWFACTTWRCREPDPRGAERGPAARARGARARLAPHGALDRSSRPRRRCNRPFGRRLARHRRGARRRRRSPRSGRGSTMSRSAWRSTSARRPWPDISATCVPARCSPARAR